MNSFKIMASAAALCAALSAPAMAQFKPALDESRRIANDAKSSQQTIDRLDDETTRLVNDFRANLKQLEAAQRYNASLERNVTGQETQIERLRQDIENVSGLQEAMLPLMEDMVESLETLVGADLPFNLGERQDRVERLSKAMSDPDISAAQSYRLIVEAFQIENEYGRTIGAYQGTADIGGESLSGEFLRVGRIALIFKTPDDSVLAIYDKDQGGYVNLSKSFLPDVKLGMRMAKEQTAPALLPVPVKAPTSAE